MPRTLFNILIYIFLPVIAFAQINRDAGLVIPFTKNAKLTVSSGENAELIRDGNPGTAWESLNPLPERFISNRNQNLFLNNSNFRIYPETNKLLPALDGNLNTRAKLVKGEYTIKLYNQLPLKYIAIKYNSANPVTLNIYYTNGKTLSLTLGTEKNYNLQLFETDNTADINEIKLISNTDFELFEIAAIDKNPVEWIQFDFRQTREIGNIISHQINWDALDSITISYSTDANTWNKIFNIKTGISATLNMLVEPLIYARYIRINLYVKVAEYKKAAFSEFAVYDRFGQFGKPVSRKSSGNSWSESFGINSIWGWGYGVSSSVIGTENGSGKFKQLTANARSYHRLDWDIIHPGDKPDFLNREQNKPLTNKWLNWDEEYGIWKSNSMGIDVCILFNEDYFSADKWENTFDQSKLYGEQFAGYFFNSNLINLVEIGNEPWEYPKNLYKEIYAGMADGIKSVAPQSKVLMCATQAFDAYDQNDNYISNFIGEGIKPDGLNTHIYSYLFSDNDQRIAVKPEDRRSETWGVNNLKRWAKSNNFPEKIYVNEFGYDSDGGGEECTHSNCVSEKEQAIYGLRQALIFFSLGVEQFYWYFYANVDYSSIMHNRSGLLSSYAAGFGEKLSFAYFKNTYQLIGNLYFKDVVLENEKIVCFSLADSEGNLKAYVAWRPTDSNHSEKKWMNIPLEKQVTKVVSPEDSSLKISYKREIGKLRIALDGSPVFIFF